MSHFAIIGSRGYPSYYGGFETLVRRLAPHLAEQGHAVTVYGRDRQSEREVVHDDGIVVRNTWGIESKSVSTLSFGFTASIDAARRECDAALVLNVANGFFLPMLRRAGIPTCVNVDGVEWLRGKWGAAARSVFRTGARLTATYADHLIYDSESLRAIWATDLGRGDGHFIPYGAAVLGSVGHERLRVAGLPTAGYVLVVARVTPENNVDLLLDAVDRMPKRPEVIVVGDGNYRQPTTDRLGRLAADGSVRWLGHVRDDELLNELWANAGVYWHGHSVGGTNPALLHALGAGAPTIAFDSVFNREVIGRNAQLVPKDPAILARRLVEVLESPETAALFRRSGIDVVRKRYVWGDVCAKYRVLLENVAQASGRRSAYARGHSELVDASDRVA